jgi:hypothetical protein
VALRPMQVLVKCMGRGKVFGDCKNACGMVKAVISNRVNFPINENTWHPGKCKSNTE